MLKKRERLDKNAFDHYFKTGARYHTPLLTLVHSKHSAFHGAAVVGKKVAKQAVERNTLRRRLYAALYSLKTQRDLTGVFIVLAKPQAKHARYSELKSSLSEAIGRINKSR